MKSEWVKKDLTIDDIQIRRTDLSKECVKITGYYPGNFEPKALDEMLKEPNAGETIDLMKEITKRYMDKYKEDAELCIICDMAIEYLKIKEKEIGK